METIKSGTEISQIFKQGKRFHTPFITFIVLDSPCVNHSRDQHGCYGRVAFIAGKKLGNAVWRNKAKRRMRAIARDLNVSWENKDVIFLAKKPLTVASYSKVLRTSHEAYARFAKRAFHENE